MELVASLPKPMVFLWPFGEPSLDHLTSLEFGWVYPSYSTEILVAHRIRKLLSGTVYTMRTMTRGFLKID